MQTTIDIDAQLLARAEQLASRKDQALSVLVEEALRDSLRNDQQKESTRLYGEPLTDGDIEESGRVTFGLLDEEENRAAPG